MLAPSGNAVALGPGGVEYRLPELFDCLIVADPGKHAPCPCLAGHGCNAPLVFVLHRIAYGLDYLPAHLHRFAPLFLVHAVKTVGVLRFKIYHRGQSFRAVQKLLLFPLAYLAQAFKLLIFNVLESERLVRPLDAHLGGSCLVALLNDKLDKFRLVKLGADNDVLLLADIDANAHNKLGIAL